MAMNIPAPVQILRYNVPEGTTSSAFESYIKETITPGAFILATGRVIDDTPRSLDNAREIPYLPVYGLYVGIENSSVPYVVIPIAGSPVDTNELYNGISPCSAPFIYDVIGDAGFGSSLRNRGYLGESAFNIDTIGISGIYRPRYGSSLPEEVTDMDNAIVLCYGDNYTHYQILLYFDATLPTASRTVKIYTRVSYEYAPSGPEDWSPWQSLGGGSSLTAGDGISITDGAVAVDNTVVRTEGDQDIKGSLRIGNSSVSALRISARATEDDIYSELTDGDVSFHQGSNGSSYARVSVYGTAGSMGDSSTASLSAYNGKLRARAAVDVIISEEGAYATAPSTRSTPVDNEIITHDFLSTRYLPISGGTLTGGLFGTSIALSESIIDVSLGSCFTKTITAATTFVFTGVPSNATARFSLVLTNGGSQTVTWPSSVKWSGGANPELAASGVDVFTFLTVDGGTTWYGAHSVQGAA